ncbi:MAG: T9SS type A sorting domain-containing protein [Bacteroidales bacterium]|nr:T9SS type A sorting domain-containing protein [Bacteroidales bacterium]
MSKFTFLTLSIITLLNINLIAQIDLDSYSGNKNILSKEFGDDIGICKIENPNYDYCGLNSLQPKVWIKNYGDNTVDSCRVTYRLDFFMLETYFLQEQILAGDSILVIFDEVLINSGNHSISFGCSYPNGEEDVFPANNSLSISFDFSFGKQYRIELMTDNYPGETSWSLTDENDVVLANNGTLSQNTLYLQNLCLPTGCYTFTILDSFGDGICGIYGDGYYNIFDIETETLISTGCDFGNGTTFEFCVETEPNVIIVNFNKSNFDNCTGEITFYDMSICNPPATEWLWDFGDGHSSTEQNPTHEYTMNDYYDVSLTVTNSLGTSSLSIPHYIEVIRQTPPHISDEYFCTSGETIVFHAPEGYDDIYWYIDPTTSTPELVYNSFTLENLLSDSTIYYQYVNNIVSHYVGLEDNSGVGGYFGFAIDRAVYFDAHTDLTLKSSKVYASGSAQRTFTLKDSDGLVLDTRTINIDAGENVIDLNFFVPEGTDYAIHVNTSNNLAYSGDYDGPNVGYPFTIPNLISFTGNNYSDSFWYFFYNIEVFEGSNLSCTSAITPLSAILSQPSVEIGNDTSICSGSSIVLQSSSEFQQYLWNTDENTETITVSTAGNYSLTVTDQYSCTAESSIAIANFDEIEYNIETTNYTSENYGSASISIISGDEPISVAWSNDFTDFEITNLIPGTYYFTLVDINGCEQNDSAIIVDYSQYSEQIISSNILIYPNPANEFVIIEMLEKQDLKIDFYDVSGRLMLELFDLDIKTTIDISDFSPGTYFINIKLREENFKYKLLKQ